MPESWVETAIESALLVVDNDRLVKAAGQHVQMEGEWTDGKIRPSLLGGDCTLQTAKKFRGHGPQPHSHWMASRQGKPSATTNVIFARGFLGEGLLVAALKEYAEISGEYEVLGCAPELLFEADPDYQAHPDLLVLRKGQLELIQIKTPSTYAVDRAKKLGESGAIAKYRTQMVTEMYVGREMGLEIERSHLLMFSWEGGRPGTDQADDLQLLVIPMHWEDSMKPYIEGMADEIRQADGLINVTGHWPNPVNDETKYNKWPCSYCPYARTRLYEGQAICTEVSKWETPEDPQERRQKLSDMATQSPTS